MANRKALSLIVAICLVLGILFGIPGLHVKIYGVTVFENRPGTVLADGHVPTPTASGSNPSGGGSGGG